MLVLGHVGLTIGLARALSREVDVRWVAVASMLPDIIDKPLRYCIALAFTQGSTRTVGHSLTVIVCQHAGGAPLAPHHPWGRGGCPDASYAFVPG